MANELQIFENPEFGQVRAVTIDGEPWFVGKDVAVALGYVDTKNALKSHVDSEDKQLIQRWQITTLEIPNRGLTIINESGLYSLILSSKLPSAKKFKRWVTSEILPAVRKTGCYGAGAQESLLTIEDAFRLAELINNTPWDRLPIIRAVFLQAGIEVEEPYQGNTSETDVFHDMWGRLL